MIRLATVFSGIGSIEWALKRMNIEHEIVFACDNGDIELKDINIDEARKKIFSLKTLGEQKKYEDELFSNTKKTNFVKKSYLANYKIDEIKLLAVNIVKTSNQNVLVSDAAEFLIEKVKKKKFNKNVLIGFITIFKNCIRISNDNINWVEGYIKLGREVSKIQKKSKRKR